MTEDKLQEQVYALRDERDDLQEELRQREEQLHQARQQVQTLEEQQEQLQEKLHQTGSEKDELLSEIDALKTRLEQQQRKIQQARQERDNLREQLQEERRRAESSLDRLDDEEEKLAELRRDTQTFLEELLDAQQPDVLSKDLLMAIYQNYVAGTELLSAHSVVLHPSATPELWVKMLRQDREACERWLREHGRALRDEQVRRELAKSNSAITLMAVGQRAKGELLQKVLLRLVAIEPETAADLLEHHKPQVVAEALGEEASRLLAHQNQRLRRQALRTLQGKSRPASREAASS